MHARSKKHVVTLAAVPVAASLGTQHAGGSVHRHGHPSADDDQR